MSHTGNARRKARRKLHARNKLWDFYASKGLVTHGHHKCVYNADEVLRAFNVFPGTVARKRFADALARAYPVQPMLMRSDFHVYDESAALKDHLYERLRKAVLYPTGNAVLISGGVRGDHGDSDVPDFESCLKTSATSPERTGQPER